MVSPLHRPRFLLAPLGVGLLLACSGAQPPGSAATPPDAGETTDTAPRRDTSSDTSDTSVDPIGATAASATTGTSGDTAVDCGPDCYMEDGLCIFPSRQQVRSPMDDASIDWRLQTFCGPLAFVVCDTGALGFALWSGSENPVVEVYDPSTRAWVASYVEEDTNVGPDACGNSYFAGDVTQLPCALELLGWIYGPSGYQVCDILDSYREGYTGYQDTGPLCDNDPAVCIRDEWPR